VVLAVLLLGVTLALVAAVVALLAVGPAVPGALVLVDLAALEVQAVPLAVQALLLALALLRVGAQEVLEAPEARVVPVARVALVDLADLVLQAVLGLLVVLERVGLVGALPKPPEGLGQLLHLALPVLLVAPALDLVPELADPQPQPLELPVRALEALLALVPQLRRGPSLLAPPPRPTSVGEMPSSPWLLAPSPTLCERSAWARILWVIAEVGR